MSGIPISFAYIQASQPVSTSLYASAIQKPEIHTVPPSLHIEKINICDYPSAKKVASAWKKAAKEKSRVAKKEKEKDQFDDCEWVSGMFQKIFANKPAGYAFVCKDEKGNYQGMMHLSVNPEYVKIDFLVTNPTNIRSSVNASETKKVTGAGTALLKKAEQIAVENGKSEIKLTSRPSALAFYIKNGFYNGGKSLWNMSKTVQKIDSQITPLLQVA